MAATQVDQESASSGSVEPPIRGDDFLAAAAEMLGETFMCKKCGVEVGQAEAVKKSVYTTWCKRCNKSWSMLYRSMSWPPLDFSSMSAEDQQSFWKSCREVEVDAARVCWSSW